MPDRADYLARTLLSRLRSLQVDDVATDRARAHAQVRDMVTKVLAVELGVIDGPTIAAVTEALPSPDAPPAPLSRDVQEVAQFLRVKLHALL